MIPLASSPVLGTRVDATSYDDATARILGWARDGGSHYVCCANVHMVMEGHDDPEFQGIVNGAALVTPDGMPLVWSLRRRGHPQTRVYGPDLMLHVCEAAESQRVPVGLHGGLPGALPKLVAELHRRYPALPIVHAESPPFRPLTGEERAAEIDRIAASGARILFVGLGCPKQERWMADRHRSLVGVQLGVGAAFSFLAGEVRQAPRALQAAGLEWAFRLAVEPRRLARRYVVNNTRFLALAAAETLTRRRGWTR